MLLAQPPFATVINGSMVIQLTQLGLGWLSQFSNQWMSSVISFENASRSHMTSDSIHLGTTTNDPKRYGNALRCVYP